MADYLLTIYEDDDTTVLTSFGTATAHARPWLRMGDYGSEAEVNFAEGSATIGEVTGWIVDPQTGATQSVRGATALLADTAGIGQLVGHRAVLEEVGGRVLKDGVLGDLELEPDLSQFAFAVKDIRERERRQRLFVESGWGANLPATAHIRRLLPRGVDGGYGRRVPGGAATMPTLAVNVTGTYTSGGLSGSGSGGIFTSEYHAAHYGGTEADVAALFAATGYQAVYNEKGSFVAYQATGAVVRWRLESGGSWTELADIPAPSGATPGDGSSYFGLVLTTQEEFFRGVASPQLRLSLRAASSGDLPTDGASIRIEVYPALGPVTEHNPIYIEASFGQIAQDIYDGYYTATPSRVRYDATAMAAFVAGTPLARARIEAAVDDAQAWLESNVYKPARWAPALGADQTLRPVADRLPEDGETLIDLDATNIVDSRWRHAGGETINRVVYRYTEERYSNVRTRTGAEGEFRQNAWALVDQEREDAYVDVASVALFGERELAVEAATLRAFDFNSSTTYAKANARYNLAATIGREHAESIFDRRAYGAYEAEVTALRSDTAVEASQVGDWCIVADPALPEYATGERGSNRLMQITRRADIDLVTTRLTLSDAGPDDVPYAVPVIGNLTVVGDQVTVDVTTVPTDARVVVEYAISATTPTNDAEWLALGSTLTTATLTSPPLPDGVVWVRAQSRGKGRVRSAWTAMLTDTIALDPGLQMVGLVWDEDALRYVLQWSADAETAGLYVEWEVYTAGASVPTVYTNDESLDAVLLAEWEIPATLAYGEALAVRVTPRGTYTGGVGGVGGTDGGATGDAVVIARDSLVPAAPFDVPPAVLLLSVEVVAQTATTFDIEAVTVDPDGTDVPGLTLVLHNLAAPTTISDDPVGDTRTSVWRFTKPVFSAGDGSVSITAELFGRQPAQIPVTVPSQERDTVAVQMSVERDTGTAATANTVRVQVTATAPNSGPVPTITPLTTTYAAVALVSTSTGTSTRTTVYDITFGGAADAVVWTGAASGYLDTKLVFPTPAAQYAGGGTLSVTSITVDPATELATVSMSTSGIDGTLTFDVAWRCEYTRTVGGNRFSTGLVTAVPSASFPYDINLSLGSTAVNVTATSGDEDLTVTLTCYRNGLMVKQALDTIAIAAEEGGGS